MLWPGHAAIHFGQNPWRIRRQETIERGDFKTGVFDQFVDLAVHITSRADDLLNRIEAVLPLRNLRIMAAPVLEEDEPAAEFQDAANFGQGRGCIRDRAQSQRGYDRIEAAIFERQ